MSVYFAVSGPYVKVGFSDNPPSRVASVTRLGKRPADVPHGAPATLIGWVPGDRNREQQIHDTFARDRVAGEWFYLELDEVNDLIWSDPAGIILDRVTAQAVFLALEYPTATREQIEAAGVQVELPGPNHEMADVLDEMFGRRSA